MTCKMCRERGKTWEGDDPNCAFVGEFTDNWSCATINAIRDICYEGNYPALSDEIHYQHCEDDKYAIIRIYDVEGIHGYALWVQWYKNRGRTEQMWLLGWDGPRIPTEAELLAIIEYYKE